MYKSKAFYLDKDHELKEFCNKLADSQWIGVDTEFIRERTYYPQPCLIQLSSDHAIACVDVVSLNDLEPLKSVLFEPEKIKLMHACGQDLEIFHLLFGGIPPNIFDTQVAAAFTGVGDQVSYAMLVEEICHVHLGKAHTRARWCNRPLSEAEVRYAEDDVRYLPAIYEKMADELERLGRRQWFNAEMEILVKTPVFTVNEKNAWKRIGSLKSMAGRQLACAKALTGWREKLAQQRNLPRTWIMADKLLVRIAETLPGIVADLSSIEEVTDKLVKRNGQQILQIVADSREHNESDQPMRNRRPDAREKALKKGLARILDNAAEDMKIPASVLATRRDLEAMIQGERDLAVLRGWRNEIVGEDLIDYLESQVS